VVGNRREGDGEGLDCVSYFEASMLATLKKNRLH
jgi:hypothetical protein